MIGYKQLGCRRFHRKHQQIQPSSVELFIGLYSGWQRSRCPWWRRHTTMLEIGQRQAREPRNR